MKKLKLKWVGRREYNRFRLFRLVGERGRGPGFTEHEWSWKLSFAFEFKLADFWIGLYPELQWSYNDHIGEWEVWVCLIPCFPLRIHFHRSWGGRFE